MVSKVQVHPFQIPMRGIFFGNGALPDFLKHKFSVPFYPEHPFLLHKIEDFLRVW